MQFHLKIHREPEGAWSLRGVPGHAVRAFAELAEALEWAKRACNSGPALIELHIDDLYIVVHQQTGWPNKICRPRGALPTSTVERRRKGKPIGWAAAVLARSSIATVYALPSIFIYSQQTN